MISCRDWWPWTKPGYITMTRRQSNTQWSGGHSCSPRPSPKKFRVQKSAGKVLASIFLWSRRHPHWLSSKGQTINAEYYLCWCNWRTFWRKNAAGRSPCRSCSCTTTLRFTGHLQPRGNWPTWTSSVLITHPILRIWPRRTTTCSLDWKKQLKGRHFSSDAEAIVAAETWLDGQLSEFFLSGLQKLEQRAKKCIELRGEYVE